jgi:hypothetical protein
MTPESARLRGQVAAIIRHHGAGAGASEVGRDLRAARAEEYLRDLVADTPLTADQRVRLAGLLLPGDRA